MDTVGAENSCRENDVNTNMFQNKSQLPKTKVGVKLLEKSSHLIHLFIVLFSFKGYEKKNCQAIKRKTAYQYSIISSMLKTRKKYRTNIVSCQLN